MKYLSSFTILLITLLASSCGSDERCFDCTLRSSAVEVCQSTFQEQAALNNIEVNTLDEYLELIGPNGTGFTCVEKTE